MVSVGVPLADGAIAGPELLIRGAGACKNDHIAPVPAVCNMCRVACMGFGSAAQYTLLMIISAVTSACPLCMSGSVERSISRGTAEGIQIQLQALTYVSCTTALVTKCLETDHCMIVGQCSALQNA